VLATFNETEKKFLRRIRVPRQFYHRSTPGLALNNFLKGVFQKNVLMHVPPGMTRIAMCAGPIS
jgi:hypothetical protein